MSDFRDWHGDIQKRLRIANASYGQCPHRLKPSDFLHKQIQRALDLQKYRLCVTK